jgi:RimJ/RimL family protein N-acetyltransferase
MIIGERVRLRAIERSDIPTFVRWFNDPEVRHTLDMFAPMSTAAEERWFERRLEAENEYLFSIEGWVEGRWIHLGNIGLHRVDWKNRGAILGIVLGEKDQWDRGFGTEAVRLMLGFAFRELSLHRVQLDVFAFNPRAIRCYEKAGFRHEGTLRDAFFRDGVFHDVHRMAVLETEFDAPAIG